MPGADEEIEIWTVLQHTEGVDEHSIFADESNAQKQ